MKTYNVAVRVVHLLEAEDAGAAVARLEAALKRAGFEPMTDDRDGDQVSVGAVEAEDGAHDYPLPGEPETNAQWAHRTGLPGNLREPWRE